MNTPQIIEGIGRLGGLALNPRYLIQASRQVAKTLARSPRELSADCNGKDTLIFLPGFGTSIDTYATLLDEVKRAGFDVLTNPHHKRGVSALLNRGSLDAQIIDAQSFIDKAVEGESNSRIHLLGHSLGGTVATATCEQLPAATRERVANVITLSSQMGPDDGLGYLPGLSQYFRSLQNLRSSSPLWGIVSRYGTQSHASLYNVYGEKDELYPNTDIFLHPERTSEKVFSWGHFDYFLSKKSAEETAEFVGSTL